MYCNSAVGPMLLIQKNDSATAAPTSLSVEEVQIMEMFEHPPNACFRSFFLRDTENWVTIGLTDE